MIVDTKAYGPVELDERQKIDMSQGLYGFEGLRHYILLDAHQRPYYWLQSLEQKEVAFVLIDPCIIRPDYDALIEADDLEALELKGPGDERLLQFAIVTIPEEHQDMTANFQGPIVINRENRMGRQCISRNDKWQVRHNILQEMSSAGRNAC